MKTLQFSHWEKWDNRLQLNVNELLRYPGIYALLISEHDMNGQLFDWQKEIVYFGMTNSIAGLKGRLSQFDNVLKDRRGHGGAERFRYDYEDGKGLAKILYVSICPFKDFKLEKMPDITPENLLVHGQVAMAEFVAFAEYLKIHERLPKYNDKKASPKRPKIPR